MLLMRQFLSVCRGNETSYGLLLGIWLAWGALGTAAARHVFKKMSLSSAVTLLMTAVYSGFVSLVLIKFIRIFIHVTVGEFVSLFQLSVYASIFTSVPCLIGGFLFGFLTRHSVQVEVKGEAAGFVYIFESIGAFAAGILITLMAPFINPATLYLIIGLCVALLIAVMDRTSLSTVLNVCIILILLILSPAINNKLNTIYWNSFDEAFDLVEQEYTRYGEAAVVEWADELYYYFNGVKQTALVDSLTVQQLAALCIVQHPKPEKICLIGGSVSGLPTALLQLPGSQLDVLEIDKQAYEMVYRHLPEQEKKALDSDNISIIFDDARHYLKSPSEYDMILINTGHPTTALSNRNFTLENFNLLKDHLANGGVLGVCSFTAGDNFMGKELLSLNSSLYHTLKQCFTNVIAIPGDAAHYFASQDSILSGDSHILSERYINHDMDLKFIYPQFFQYTVVPERLAFFQSLLSEFPDFIINTDFRPVAFLYDYLMRHKIEKNESLQMHKILNPPVFCILFLILSIWILTSLLFPSRALYKSSVFIIAVVVGYCAMVFDVVLILGFQTLYGNIYTWIGVLIAFFMIGSSSAAFWVNEFLSRINPTVVFLLLFAICLQTLIIYLLLHSMIYSPFLFLPVMLISGGLIGGAFPLLCHFDFIFSGSQSSKIYTADLLGGMAGAVLVSAYFIPTLGFSQTLFIAALLSGTSCLVLFMAKRSI